MLTLLTCLKLITGSYDCSFQKIPWAKRFLRSWSARHQAVMVQATSLATIPHTGIKNRDADYWHFWSGLCDNGPSYFYHIYDCNLFSHNAVNEFQNCKTKRFLLQVAKMCFCNLMVSTASSTCRSLYFRGIPDIVCISLQFEIFLIYTGCKIKTRPGPSLAARELTSQNRDTRMEQSRSLWGDLIRFWLCRFWLCNFSTFTIFALLWSQKYSDARSLAATALATPPANSSPTGGKNLPKWKTPTQPPKIQPPPFPPSPPPSPSERACPIAAKMAKSLNSSRNYSSAPIYPAMEEYGAGLSCPMGICL